MAERRTEDCADHFAGALAARVGTCQRWGGDVVI